MSRLAPIIVAVVLTVVPTASVVVDAASREPVKRHARAVLAAGKEWR